MSQHVESLFPVSLRAVLATNDVSEPGWVPASTVALMRARALPTVSQNDQGIRALAAKEGLAEDKVAAILDADF